MKVSIAVVASLQSESMFNSTNRNAYQIEFTGSGGLYKHRQGVKGIKIVLDIIVPTYVYYLQKYVGNFLRKSIA